MTSLIISNDILATSTVMSLPASSFMSKGVISGARAVEAAVTVTDSARLPRAKYVSTFEANPLEQLPMRITPALISGGKRNKRASVTPKRGINRK